MAQTVFPVPVSLSPSRVNSFTDCPLRFRFVSIQGLPDPPTIHTTKGTLVHKVLEYLYDLDAHERTIDAALHAHQRTRDEFSEHEDVMLLNLTVEQTEQMWRDTEALVRNYFTMEDPRMVSPEGLELWVEASMGDFTMRGIIDRLERGTDGSLIISDYKTGKAPWDNQVQDKMKPMMLYAWLCSQQLGETPTKLRLLYLKDGKTIETNPSPRDIEFHAKRTIAVHNAIATACTTGNFKANKTALCKSCNYQQWCPEFGGNPEAAATEAPLVITGRTRNS